ENNLARKTVRHEFVPRASNGSRSHLRPGSLVTGNNEGVNFVQVLSETARIAQELIRFDTSNRGGGDANPEAAAAEYVRAFLHDLGLSPVVIESAPGRASVVARVSGAHSDLPALVLHGHLDVVPADAKSWSVDPFAGVVQD